MTTALPKKSVVGPMGIWLSDPAKTTTPSAGASSGVPAGLPMSAPWCSRYWPWPVLP
ncbi:MAG: hypothetical protein V9H69_06105 [Anaerolineae bacterium]